MFEKEIYSKGNSLSVLMNDFKIVRRRQEGEVLLGIYSFKLYSLPKSCYALAINSAPQDLAVFPLYCHIATS